MAQRRGGRKPSGQDPSRRVQSSAPVTRKQAARSRKERRQLRLIWIGVAVLLVVVVGVLAYALIRELVVQPSSPVAVVNGEKVSTQDYQAYVTYDRLMLYREQAYQRQQFAENEELLAYIDELYQSRIQSVPQDALDRMIEDVLIAEQARELGIQVSEQDIQREIEARFGYTQNLPTPTPDPSVTLTATLPVPTSITQQEFQTGLEGEMEYMAGAGVSERQYRDIVGRELLRAQVGQHFANLVPETGLVAQVRLIQLDSDEDAQAAKARLDAGEDFAELAGELSTDPNTSGSGGDLGWITLAQVTSRYGQDFERVAFNIGVGSTSDVVPSNEKYYLIQVLDRNPDGPLPEAVLSSRRANALDDWLADELASDEVQVERLLSPDQIPPDPLS